MARAIAALDTASGPSDPRETGATYSRKVSRLYTRLGIRSRHWEAGDREVEAWPCTSLQGYESRGRYRGILYSENGSHTIAPHEAMSEDGETRPWMEWICSEDRGNPGEWRVEVPEKGYITVFSGPEAQRRAEEYAAFENAQARWQERSLYFEGRHLRSV